MTRDRPVSRPVPWLLRGFDIGLANRATEGAGRDERVRERTEPDLF
jgi:hypothetical protein